MAGKTEEERGSERVQKGKVRERRRRVSIPCETIGERGR